MNKLGMMKYANRVIYVFIFMIATLIACKQPSQNNDKVVKQAVVVDSTLQWTDYHIGELPPLGYYRGFDSVIKKWGIRYQRIDGGCEENLQERLRYEKDNPKYFKVLERRFGKNWRQRFYAEVRHLDSTLQKKRKLK